MKILERKEKPTAIVNCPRCGSKLEVEEGDIWWHKDVDGGYSPYITCAACSKDFDVEGWSNIRKIL